jgi:hypothetical protein
MTQEQSKPEGAGRTFLVSSDPCELSRVAFRVSYLLPSSRRKRSMYSTLSWSAPQRAEPRAQAISDGWAGRDRMMEQIGC